MNYSEGVGVIKNDICEYLKHYKHVACGVVAYKSEFIPARSLSLVTTIIKTELGQLTFDSSRENIENTTTNKTILSNIIQNLENDHSLEWSKDALQELSRIPGFVRGKVKRNVEKFASQNNKKFITLEIMFAAKEAVNA